MRLPDGTVRKYRRSFNDRGHAHELTFSCYRGLPLLGKDRSRRWFVDALQAARLRHHFELWAYVIMPEHVHLLLLPGAAYDMSVILQGIKQSVARKAIGYLRDNSPHWLERLRSGGTPQKPHYCFWQRGGGYDRNITRASTAWDSVIYIHRNPVKRGLAAREVDWPWSSARWYAGLDGVVLEMDGCPPDP
ncbi:MAG: transposase [Phycisphaerae bacterium]|nr:transposase [Phycisphaerae bacterium]NUQ47708.1 transposase [Phycisphaerae bacterium]